MKRIKLSITFLIVLLGASSASGQDIHFSQVTRTSFLLNPAFIGMYNGNFQATMNWKDQWRSINNSFRTYASSAVASIGRTGNGNEPFYAIGLHFAKDVAGDVELGTTNIGGSFATLIKVARNQRLSFGVQGGYYRVGVSTANMEWGSQYNGVNFDPSLFNGEGVEYLPQQFFDASLGVGYWYHVKGRTYGVPQDLKAGISVYHLTRPKNNFDLSNFSRLPMRFVFHGSAIFGTARKGFFWYPNLTYSIQGRQHEFMTGVFGKYLINQASTITGKVGQVGLTLGLNTRITNVVDAIIPQIFVDFSAFSVGVSYDINVSGLNLSSKYRGGLEMSIRFTNLDRFTHKNPFSGASNI